MYFLNYMACKSVFRMIAGVVLLLFFNFSANAISVSLGVSKESGVSASVGLGDRSSRSGASVSTGGSDSGASVSASIGSRDTGAGVSADVGTKNTAAGVKARVGNLGAKARVGLGRGSVNLNISAGQARKIGSLSNLNKRQLTSTMRGLGNTETVKLRKSCKAILASPVSYSAESVQVCRVILEL